MSEQPNEEELGAAKGGLAHVETKSGEVSTKALFKCEDCDHTTEITAEIQTLMEEDKPYDVPKHHDKPMKIFVVG